LGYTKIDLYVKIIFMKSIKNVRTLLLIMLSAFTLLFLAAGIFSLNFARADGGVSLSVYLPATKAEYYNLNSPKEVYYDDGLLIVNDDNSRLLISRDLGEYTVRTEFSSLSYIKKYDEDNVLINDNGSIYKYGLTDFTKTPVQDNGENIGTDFDFNGDYLITHNSTTVVLYTLSGTTATKYGSPVTVFEKSPVAINDSGIIFYLEEQNLLVMSTVDGSSVQKISLSVSPTKIIANDDFAYLINENSSAVYRIDLSESTKSVQTLVAEGSEDYHLSNVVKPSGICFMGDNLLIADSDPSMNSVSEFAVSGGKLEFTGFAVAKGKTAFNRISACVSSADVNTYGDVTAFYDGNKIMLQYKDGSFDNVLISSISGITVNRFALGEKTLALCCDITKTVRIINLKTKQNLFGADITVSFGEVLSGITFRNGFYYVSVLKQDINESGAIYKISEDNGEVTLVTEFTGRYTGSATPLFAVTAEEDIFLTDMKNNKIVKLVKADDYGAVDIADISSMPKIIKLAVDMDGALFALTEKSVVYFNGTDHTEMAISVYNLDGDEVSAVSFALNFDRKEVPFIFYGEEFVYSSKDLPNMAADSFAVPTGYVTKGENAYIDDLTIYSVEDGANVYSVKFVSGEPVFAYNGMFKENDCSFVFTGEIEYSVPAAASGTRTQTFYILTSLDSLKDPVTVIVKATDTQDVTDISDPSCEEAFVATDVNMYYIPIISRDDEFVLDRNGLSYRLDKGAKISTLKIFEFIGREFYYAMAEDNGETVYGYVPVNFTAEILSDDVVPDTFTWAKVKKTVLYSDKTLSEKIVDVSDNANVKLLSTENGVSLIAVKTESGAWIKGYVSESAVIVNEDRSVTVSLIIIALSVSVFATSLFIIFRRKG